MYFGKNLRAVTAILYEFCVFQKECRSGFGCFGTSVGYIGKSLRSVSGGSYKFCVFRKEYRISF